ncbi:MAG: hypothetical protein AUJ28_01865 [Parcubacteria group bacterium CG1_02_37_51]|uniref:SCP domain-containing protein n=2 Tax=Candidatus Komeiliibacteriota TaxID=1817908 RepID=A0A2M8DS90_9BACT|nr:MAG: hypothetical protein AUJ28_01865 [Parcubacteria group bacterium CG1_02_37_51]PIY93951.1 MAG: hypothetical protein COY67_03445 [Candidatus Komeilibacteria bacterium CG_4_10_14_0_8_um_filter_37_78]PJC02240.1 MAG: hypothetical protein CO073_00525 [Candidatus Komeilibacteria bacterium CG_4_9_14_0_8_um_filter_36_9]
MNRGPKNIIFFIFAFFCISLISGLFYIPVTFSKASILDSPISQPNLVELTNQIRAVKELSPLLFNDQLQQAAMDKANDLIKNNYFSHNSPQGKPFNTWIEETGYEYQIIGENLATGYATNKEVMKAWMDSPTHRDNILNQKYREIGIAVIKKEIDHQEQTLVVQIFGSPRKLYLSELFTGYNQSETISQGLLYV